VDLYPLQYTGNSGAAKHMCKETNLANIIFARVPHFSRLYNPQRACRDGSDIRFFMVSEQDW
jgi:hypothetical protein